MQARLPEDEPTCTGPLLVPGRFSALREALRAERRREEASMTPEQRVLLALELSDLCLLLREACSGKRSG